MLLYGKYNYHNNINNDDISNSMQLYLEIGITLALFTHSLGLVLESIRLSA